MGDLQGLGCLLESDVGFNYAIGKIVYGFRIEFYASHLHLLSHKQPPTPVPSSSLHLFACCILPLDQSSTSLGACSAQYFSYSSSACSLNGVGLVIGTNGNPLFSNSSNLCLVWSLLLFTL